MRKMKDSGVAWIGEIPEGWKIKRLKFICTINPRVNIDDINLETEVSFLPMENIKDGYFINTIVKKFSEYSLSYNIFNNGDILLAKVTPCFENGNIAIANNLENCIGFGTSEIFVVRVNNIDNKFLFYYFRNELFRQRAIATMSGTGGLKRISPQFMQDENILFPPLPEQHRIADYLDTKCAEINHSMDLVRQGIDKLKVYKMSVITEAVTKGLDPDVPMKDSGVPWIGEIPAKWGVRRLKTISESIVVGIVINPSQYISEDGLPYIYGGDIHEGKIDFTTCRKISKENSEKNIKTRLSENDILTVRVGYPGLSAVVPYECEGGNCASVILTKRGNFDSFWYCYCMNSSIIKSQIDIVKYGAAQEQFNLAHMIEFLVPYPPLSEQHRIATYLDAKCAEIDTIIAKKQSLLDKLSAYKKSLIFECVTGKREVAA